MPTELPPPSAVIWDWHPAPDRQARRRAARAARWRGLLGGAIGLAAAAAVHHFRPLAGWLIAAVALGVLVVALAFPLTLYRRLTELLARFAHAVGTAVTWLLMTVLYYLLFLPAGLLLRAGGKLAVTTRPDPQLKSYWSPHAVAATSDRYRKQF